MEEINVELLKSIGNEIALLTTPEEIEVINEGDPDWAEEIRRLRGEVLENEQGYPLYHKKEVED